MTELEVRTNVRNQFVEITDQVRNAVSSSGVQSGLCVVYCPHTTAAITINEKGGPIAVAVSAGAGCGWTATSNESWITITAGASGTGNGTVRFNVESTGGKRRTGTLTIAGRTFTVDQDKKNGD